MNNDELLRYSRHILLPQLDVEGQEAIAGAHVLIVGLGGLGSPVALYLAASGVGRLTLVDDDVVEVSNLQRQIAHDQTRVGQSKVASAAARIAEMNAAVSVEAIQARADAAWLKATAADVSLIVDCSDNAAVRYAINDHCLDHDIPWVSGAAIAFSGQVAVFDPRVPGSPCYRCLYPALSDEALSCAESGILSPITGLIGSTQAVETLRLLTGFGTSQTGWLNTYDGLSGEWRRWRLNQRAGCDCQRRKSVTGK
ncbi:molybdopterin-synthase adenylyltransferase MoeB [uncultured Thalassolituus sp.]|uniref:HesA/MoeB/ThiF family protein n=1 Tax=uncultured Thalassolituus sp. TaxID=285273 RepID=UPI0026330B87|nr:molybdopterin-synthase adenylyltransferase MoeB [uncultured Thalassolituus sp.]